MIRLYSFTSGQPEWIRYQRDTFGSFLEEEHELVIVNDAQNAETISAIDRSADELGVPSLGVELPPPRDQPSTALAEAIEYAMRKRIRDDDDLSILLHADVFACRPFSLRALFEDADVIAMPEYKASANGKRGVHYPWSGFIGLRTPALPEPDTMSFAPGKVNGIPCDAGGRFWYYMSAHPQVRVRAIDYTTPICAANGNLHLLPEPEFPLPGMRGPQLIAGSMLHYIGGTGWYGEGPDYHSRKQAWLFSLLDRLMRGELTMPPRDVPATGPWPPQ